MTLQGQENYFLFNEAFNHFNVELFGGILPQCTLTQRCRDGYAYYSRKRFGSLVDGTFIDEIAFNPSKFVHKNGDREAMQSVVHEMVHLWQYHFGKPSKPGYHNKEWVRKMESVGLVPTDTGEYGGKQTGYSIVEYPVPDGPFMQAYEKWLEKGLRVQWADVESFYEVGIPVQRIDQDGSNVPTSLPPVLPAEWAQVITSEDVPNLPLVRKKRNKPKFSCPRCSQNAWGAALSSLICGHCYDDFGDVVFMTEVV